ncbi:MAG: putative DNA binding domain-containing protein, partial [Clostridia bacterium]|nr:putative DNA binding domain-containing protein [Clostridia bacterium]
CTDYDFKQALEVKKPKSWLKSVSAFANTLGGTLFFGVTNDKVAVGVEDPQSLGEKISQLINERIKPTPIYVLGSFMEDGKAIVTVKVYAGTSTPYYYVADGVQEAYIRSGNESIIAPPHILNELVLKGLNQTYDTLKTNYKKSDYSFTFFEATFYDITRTKITESDYLSFNLVDKDGYLTNAGVLLADQNIYTHSRIFCTRWNGLTKTSVNGEAVDDKEISGGLLQQLFSAMEFVRNNTKKKWHKSGMTRVEMPEYDEEAVREAIVNGIIHREYTRLGAEVCVDIYDDRLEVTSPGCMMSGKIIDKEVDDVVASERRNPVLADIFARMKFMERRGSGLKKITDNTNALFNDGKNHVEFFSDRNYFKVTIHNALYGKKQKGASVNANVNAGVNAGVKLSATQKAIIQLMRENTQITIKEMASALGKNETTVSRNISQLKEAGVVKRVGSDKTGHWELY